MKEDHGLDRNHLARALGDTTNAVPAAVGYNFRRLLNWLRLLFALFWADLGAADQQFHFSQTA